MKITPLKCPKLNPIILTTAIENMLGSKPGFYITMYVGQWDNFLDEGYYRQDATLIELDNNGIPIAAYKYVNTSTSGIEKGATEDAQ